MEVSQLTQLEKLYTIKEASETTGYDERQIMYKIRREQITAQKVGWIWVLPEATVIELKNEKEAKDRKKAEKEAKAKK
jgi:hypothetical protein